MLGSRGPQLCESSKPLPNVLDEQLPNTTLRESMRVVMREAFYSQNAPLFTDTENFV